MTIDDRIKSERLQCDINREAAKISVLSSGKFDKYEHLTGEEILPSNKQQIIEQAKSTYSPLGKAFEKQIKTIEDQGEKQIKAIQSNKQQSVSDNDYKDKLLISREIEIFKDIYNKRLDKVGVDLFWRIIKRHHVFCTTVSSKNFRKSFRILPLSIYLHKTVRISKYLQFKIYKLNQNIVGRR